MSSFVAFEDIADDLKAFQKQYEMRSFLQQCENIEPFEAVIGTTIQRIPAYIHYTADQAKGETKYSIDSLFDLLVFCKLTGASTEYIARRLQNKRKLAQILGFYGDTPTAETIRNIPGKRIPEELMHRIETKAEDVREDVFDSVGYDTASSWLRPPGTKWMDDLRDGDLPDPADVTESEKDRAYNKVAGILHDIVDFERADNSQIEHETLVDYAGYLSRRDQTPNKGIEQYREEVEDPTALAFSPESYRRAVRNKERLKVHADNRTKWIEPGSWSVDKTDDYGGDEDWHSTLEEGIERFVSLLKERDVIDGPVPCMIDGSIRSWHKHPNGADRPPKGVYQEAYFDTNYGWKDITISAVVDNRSVVLANVSQVPGDKFFEAVKYLIDRALDLVDVEHFLADSAFANTDICRYIDAINEHYVMKKSEYPKVKRKMAEMDGLADWTSYELHSPKKGITHDTTLFAVEKRSSIGTKKGVKRDEDTEQTGLNEFNAKQQGQLSLGGFQPDEDIDLVAFVTNKGIESVGIDPKQNPIGHNSDRTVWGCAQAYRRRWAIETVFRQVKHDFLPKTHSRDLGTRRFYWMVAIMLYNSWAVLNLLVQEGTTEQTRDGRPFVSSGVFLERLANEKPPPG